MTPKSDLFGTIGGGGASQIFFSNFFEQTGVGAAFGGGQPTAATAGFAPPLGTATTSASKRLRTGAEGHPTEQLVGKKSYKFY